VNRSVFVVGAGGHAKMVLEAMRSQVPAWNVVACLDNHRGGGSLLGVPVCEDTPQTIMQYRDNGVLGFVAIGENRVRMRLMQHLRQLEVSLATVVAGSAFVSPSAILGPGTVVMHGAVVGADARMGCGCILNTHASVDHDCDVKDFAHIAPGSHLAGNVSVGEGAMLGVGCSVIPKVTIGDWSVLGAGAVVVRDVPPQVTWVGCPARPIGGSRSLEGD
jgi:UDP-perosamine 4-acetyltransferase